jgi:hypothetical protein
VRSHHCHCILKTLAALPCLLVMLGSAPAGAVSTDMLGEAKDGSTTCSLFAVRPDQVQNPSLTTIKGLAELNCAHLPGAPDVSVTWRVCLAEAFVDGPGVVPLGLQWETGLCPTETVPITTVAFQRFLTQTKGCRFLYIPPLYRTQAYATVTYPNGSSFSFSDVSDPAPVACGP